jgi:hypothetical protein
MDTGGALAGAHPEPRISSSSAAGEPPGGGGGGFPGWPSTPGESGDPGFGSMAAHAGAGFPAASGSPRLGAGGAGGLYLGGGGGEGGGIPQFGMIPVEAGALGVQQAARDASGAGGPQLSGASSLGAPSPLPGPSGDEGGSSSGSMPHGRGGRGPPQHGGGHHLGHGHHGPPHGGAAGGGPPGAGLRDADAAGGGGGQPQVFRSEYRGVSYDKKKRKWRVQIKVAALGKSGVSVGYFDTEAAAARAYDRAAIGLLGRSNCRTILNFPMEDYDNDSVPELVGALPWGLLGGGDRRMAAGRLERGEAGTPARCLCRRRLGTQSPPPLGLCSKPRRQDARGGQGNAQERARQAAAAAADESAPHEQVPRRRQQQPQEPVAGAHPLPRQSARNDPNRGTLGVRAWVQGVQGLGLGSGGVLARCSLQLPQRLNARRSKPLSPAPPARHPLRHQVTHLGYYRTEEEAARVYDKVSISLHGDNAQTNFPIDQVGGGGCGVGGGGGGWVRRF